MFNDSLLAKQAWRLLHNKTSLFYKAFKAHFFPNSSLMEAVDSRMGSYAWKSILKGRDIIQRGGIMKGWKWRKINIWQQRWLPRKHPMFLPTCPLESFENHIIDSLIDPSTRRWNEEMVDGLFVEEDAKLIKKIPLSRHVTEDTLYWPYSTSGNYTCKSRYRFLKEEEEMHLNSQTPPICHKRVWKEVWHMLAPPKIKNFLWRACRNVFPTKQALMCRKILEDPICERCKLAVEDSVHALWSCMELDIVWADKEKWGFRCEIGFICVWELLSWMIEEGKSLELLAYTAWSVWNQRSKVRLNLQACPLHHVAEQTAGMLAQYRANTEAAGTQVWSNENGGNMWRAPPVSFVKINFDGAVFDDANMSGVGVVIRDSYGEVLALCSEKISQAYEAEVTEALATQKALVICT